MPCEELDYNQFGELLNESRKGQRLPLSATISLTDRCNLSCVHCFVHDPARDRELRFRELATEQWFRIFDQLAEAGCLWMTWTGGEILLRTDFAELYHYAKQKGFLITLFTNGTLLTAELVGVLQEWYPLLVEISLYGLTNETYARVTGVRGAYERCMQGVRLLLEAGIPLRLKTMALTLTRHEVRPMHELAAELGVRFRHDGMLFQTFHGRDISEFRLPPAELVELDSVNPIAADEFRRLYQRYTDLAEADRARGREYRYICGGGEGSCYIDPYGQMGLCQMTRPATYDLVSGTFQEGWQRLGEFRLTRVTRDFECLHCGLAGLCQRCPAFSTLEHGDPETVVEYACAVARLRAQQLGLGNCPGDPEVVAPGL